MYVIGQYQINSAHFKIKKKHKSDNHRKLNTDFAIAEEICTAEKEF